jgi:hypothetical protein
MMLENQRQINEQFNQTFHYDLISNPSPSSMDHMKITSTTLNDLNSTSVNQQYKYWNPATQIDDSTTNNNNNIMTSLDSISHEQMKSSVDQLIGEFLLLFLLYVCCVMCNKKSIPKRRVRFLYATSILSSLKFNEKCTSIKKQFHHFHDKLTLIFFLLLTTH